LIHTALLGTSAAVIKNKSPPYRVLIVDDDANITLAFKQGLEDKGFEVDAFNDSLEVLSKFSEIKNDGSNDSFSSVYDLLLLDVRMPNMSGYELYREIKKINDEVKVCFLTAYEVLYEKLKKDFLSINVGCFIKKPVDINELVSRINIELEEQIIRLNIRVGQMNEPVHKQAQISYLTAI
jgi:DNA-binding response OmpR family regulator